MMIIFACFGAALRMMSCGQICASMGASLAGPALIRLSPFQWLTLCVMMLSSRALERPWGGSIWSVRRGGRGSVRRACVSCVVLGRRWDRCPSRLIISSLSVRACAMIGLRRWRVSWLLWRMGLIVMRLRGLLRLLKLSLVGLVWLRARLRMPAVCGSAWCSVGLPPSRSCLGIVILLTVGRWMPMRAGLAGCGSRSCLP